jgi:hypothetical protein
MRASYECAFSLSDAGNFLLGEAHGNDAVNSQVLQCVFDAFVDLVGVGVFVQVLDALISLIVHHPYAVRCTRWLCAGVQYPL